MNDRAVKTFERICFVRTGTPGDANAFERALQLCEKANAELSVVAVGEVPPQGILHLMASWGASAVVADGDRDCLAELEPFLEAARRRNVRATAEMIPGSASLELIRKIQKEEHDLLIKAAEPSTGIRQLLFGHADRQLVRKCPCPVWIERPSKGARHERILVAVDPAPFHDDPPFDPIREELNRQILEMGVLLADLEGAQLHVIHVWHFYFEGPLQSRVGLTEEAVAEVGNSLKQKHEQALAELLGPYMRHISRVHLLKGHAADEISRLAASEDFDVLVMGTVCRTGIAGWIIGNTAETLLNQIECSLVALKPRNFVSPVGTE